MTQQQTQNHSTTKTPEEIEQDFQERQLSARDNEGPVVCHDPDNE